jgi:uncharacterized membrane protein
MFADSGLGRIPLSASISVDPWPILPWFGPILAANATACPLITGFTVDWRGPFG